MIYKGQDPNGPAASTKIASAPPVGAVVCLGQANGRAFLPSYAPIVEKRHRWPMATVKGFQLIAVADVEFN